MFYVSSLEILSKHQKMFLSSGKWYLSVLLPIRCNSYILFQGPLHQYTSVLLLSLIIVVERSRRLSNLLSFLTFYLHRQNNYVQCFYPAGHLFMFRWRQTEWRIFWKWWHPMEMSENSLWKQGKWMCTHMYRHMHSCACAHSHTHAHTHTYCISLSSHFIFAAFSFSLTFSLCLSLSPVSLPHCLMTLCDWWPCVIGDPVWLMILCDWWPCVIGDPVWLVILCDWWPCVIGDPAWLMTLYDWYHMTGR